MFNIKDFPVQKAKELYDIQKIGISVMNTNMAYNRLLATKSFQYISLETYRDFYQEMMDDIDIESNPMDTIIMRSREEMEQDTDQFKSMFDVNIEVPEFKKVASRVNLKVLFAFMEDETNSTYVKMKEHPEKLPCLQEEIFIHFMRTKIIDEIDLASLELISNYCSLIEYVAKNITEKSLRDYIHTGKINFKKFEEKKHNLIFDMDFERVKMYYSEPHKDIPAIDVLKLISILFTNSDSTVDDAIVVAIFDILSFAINDINTDKYLEFPHVRFIKDVLSKIN